MTLEERKCYDAKAVEEAWSYALSILRPMVETAWAIGSPELTQVMERALMDAEEELTRAR